MLAGEWTRGEAPALAAAELADLVSGAIHLRSDQFFQAMHDRQRVGWIWLAPAPASLEEPLEEKRWLTQLTVLEPHRGQGYGHAMLTALHAQLVSQGVREIWLRVYDWNEVAIRLYTRMGYEQIRKFPTDAHWRKRLP